MHYDSFLNALFVTSTVAPSAEAEVDVPKPVWNEYDVDLIEFAEELPEKARSTKKPWPHLIWLGHR